MTEFGADIAKALGLIEEARIDRNFMEYWLRFPFLRSARTGLIGVEEILPGAVHALGKDCGNDFQLWQPACFTHPAPKDFNAAATVSAEINIDFSPSSSSDCATIEVMMRNIRFHSYCSTSARVLNQANEIIRRRRNDHHRSPANGHVCKTVESSGRTPLAPLACTGAS